MFDFEPRLVLLVLAILSVPLGIGMSIAIEKWQARK